MHGKQACACSPAICDDLFQAEDDKRPVITRHALVGAAEVWRVFVRQHAAKASDYGNVLLAVDGIADDAALVTGTVVVTPQLGPGFGIVGMKDAAGVGHEYEIARSRQHASKRPLRIASRPL